MSGPKGRNDRSAAGPSDPLDAALADITDARANLSTEVKQRANNVASRAMSVTPRAELEADDDDETDEGTPSATEPEDDDIEEIEDDEEDDEDNEVVRRNPAEDDDDDDEDASPDVDEAPRSKAKSSPESKKKPGDRQQPKTTERDSDDDDEGVTKLSRKQRGKLIEELRNQLDKEQQEKAQLAERQRQLEENDKQLEAEVRRALGSEEDFEKAMEDGLRGDETAAERARIWKANRAFYNKLVGKARRDVQSDFTQAYWATLQDIPGLDKDVLAKASLSQVLKHLYEVGTKNKSEEAQERIDELENEIETWKGKYQSLKARAGVGKRSPVTGGGQAPPPKKKSLSSLLGEDGLPTAEAEHLIRTKGWDSVLGTKTKQRIQVR